MRMHTSGDGQYNWANDLREREALAAEKGALAAEKSVETQKRTVRFQALALFLAAVATGAAAFAALQAGNAVKASESIASQQAIANQFTTALTAIGQPSSAEQVAGLTLLYRTLQAQVSASKADPSERQGAYATYVTSLQVIDVYLRSTTSPGKDPPIAAIYAADQLRAILRLGPEVKTVDGGPRSSIDLSLIGLSGISWTGIRFDSLKVAYMPGIDLRGADLAGSHWGHADLADAYLQCADLRYADLRHADLTRADLRGADLKHAKLPPEAKLEDVKTARAVGGPKRLHVVNPATSYQPNNCRKTRAYAEVPGAVRAKPGRQSGCGSVPTSRQPGRCASVGKPAHCAVKRARRSPVRHACQSHRSPRIPPS